MIRPLVIAVCAAALAAPPVFAVEVGSIVPDFSAAILDGGQVSLSEALRTHRLVVVLFLSTACPYAEFFARHVRELDETYRGRGVLFVGVNSNQFETVEEMREDAREHGHAFPLVRDEKARIADLMGAARTPEAFVVGADGRLRYRGWVQSKLRSPDLQRALDALLSDKPVRLAKTKAFGCAIDRPRR
jgi:peroxiredoxin